VPSAGQEPVIEGKVRTGRWLRYGFFAGVGALAVLVVVLGANALIKRRQAHA
jgi:hypothetical protein